MPGKKELKRISEAQGSRREKENLLIRISRKGERAASMNREFLTGKKKNTLWSHNLLVGFAGGTFYN